MNLTMHVEFSPLSMMDLRRRPGEVLDDVARSGQAFVIERNGQQRACLVPISFFFPDIQPSRIAKELDNLVAAGEHFRISITDTRTMQLIFRDVSGKAGITVSVTLPHGYPNKAPIVTADPIDQSCPHCWPDGSLCICGAMETWNPGKHNVVHVLKLSRRWLTNYMAWLKAGQWPTQEGS